MISAADMMLPVVVDGPDAVKLQYTMVANEQFWGFAGFPMAMVILIVDYLVLGKSYVEVCWTYLCSFINRTRIQ